MSQLVLETVQWSSLPDIESVERVGDNDRQVLEEIRDVLVRHNRTSRFGVCLLHKHFEIGADEIAVEYTDVAARTSTVVAEPAKKNSDGNYIETVWRFKNNGPVAVTVCEQRCHYDKGHRSVHVKVGR
jgi:hypothetical protein